MLEASPGTVHAQDVCLRYCQTWQPWGGDGYSAVMPATHEEHHGDKAPRSTCRPASPELLILVCLARKVLVGGKGLYLPWLPYLSDVLPVIKCVKTSKPSWRPHRCVQHSLPSVSRTKLPGSKCLTGHVSNTEGRVTQ